MDTPHVLRQHLAALRALLALTVITGAGYPLLVWGIGHLPGLHEKAFCTGGGVGAVLSVIGARDSSGNLAHPDRVISVDEPCSRPTGGPGDLPTRVFRPFNEAVRVQCAEYGENYSVGQLVPIRGAAPEVHHYQSGRQLGFLGDPVVNVLRLNLALDRAVPVRP